MSGEGARRGTGILARYRDRLPVTAATPLITLGEGDTPLVFAERLSAELDVALYLKLEGLNPTGSFKDRGMVVAVAKALEAGRRAVIAASTGNTSASAAAYAARAEIRAVVIVPEGKIALGKLAQALVYGADVVAIAGNFDQGLRLVRELADRFGLAIVNSINPDRIEGQKTAAFEIVDALGRAPDVLAIPVGNAGNITAYWKGFVEYLPPDGPRPRMLGFEAEGAAAIVRGHPIAEPETIATAIRIGNPASWAGAVQAAEASGGAIDAVSDAEILAAYERLARREGIFVEPASAASVAGVIKARRAGRIRPGETVVAVLTGNGLKDPDTALKTPAEIRTLPAEAGALADHLGALLKEAGG
ncbi:MAG: Threonine synthase [Hydrogenibacillus schlegelii]|uniref:Threonine synthase n=1 Tax=Hydrogenibacillus schlegelii TaxID=1484 RepID=A0A2T5GBD3_HYDSH|nr:threonine synthase [Hydrogenibacillus schlegelii]PTQ53491.1 MAG: Threonine synthase [Hydrogenibacillus schlegelii]